MESDVWWMREETKVAEIKRMERMAETELLIFVGSCELCKFS